MPGNYIHALIAMSLYFLYFLALLNTQPFLFSILDTYRKILWLETYKILVPQKFVKIFTLEIKEKKSYHRYNMKPLLESQIFCILYRDKNYLWAKWKILLKAIDVVKSYHPWSVKAALRKACRGKGLPHGIYAINIQLWLKKYCHN